MTSLRIAHVLAPAPFGGLERVVAALAEGHGGRGHHVHVINVFEHGEQPVPLDVAGRPGVTSHVVQVGRRRYWQERAAVRRLCRDAGIQVVHSHGYRPDIIDSGIASGIGAARVSTVHGFTGGGLKDRLFEQLQQRALRRFDGVVAVSQLLQRQLAARGVPAGRLHCIPNAWVAPGSAPLSRAEARAALGLPADGAVLGWTGRLSTEKAPDVLLAALEQLPQPAQWTAAFIGDGPEAGSLRARADAAGLAARVRWCGAVPQASRYFSAFDVFVLSSRTEGTPIVLFEAMAAAVPIVATRVGGVPDVIGDREGWLVPSEDPAALAAAVADALARPDEAQRRAGAARDTLASAYARDPWLDRYEALYRDCAAGAR